MESNQGKIVINEISECVNMPGSHTHQVAANEHCEKARQKSNSNIRIFSTARTASNWNEYSHNCMIKMGGP